MAVQNREAPDFRAIQVESGPFTAEALQQLWFLQNRSERSSAADVNRVKDGFYPRVLVVSAAASVDNLDLDGASVLQFTGSTAQNFTGLVAPERDGRLVIVYVSGAGTITAKHNVTSTATNRLSNKTGADVTLATGASAIYVYLSSLWRQVV